MAKKSTKAEHNRRVRAVSKLLLNGASRADIVLYSSDNWQVGERQVTKYITEANKGFAESAIYNVDDQIGIAINRLNHLYMYHLKNKNFRDALTVQKEINKLFGLYAPEKKEVGGVVEVVNLTWEEMINRDAETDDS